MIFNKFHCTVTYPLFSVVKYDGTDSLSTQGTPIMKFCHLFDSKLAVKSVEVSKLVDDKAVPSLKLRKNLSFKTFIE